MRLLLVENNQLVTENLTRHLRVQYAVDIAQNFREGLFSFRVKPYDLAILDWTLPDGKGIELCQRVRAELIATPILLLTPYDSHHATITGLNAGADDCLKQPFEIEELKARLRALKRRGSKPLLDEVLAVGPLRLHVPTYTATFKDLPIRLRRKELQLLEYLMRQAGQVLHREKILEHVWDTRTLPTANTVEVHIRQLRQKIDYHYGTNLIQTVYGLGYKIEAP